MCTIALLLNVYPRWPVVVAANRDEFKHRAATSPEVLVDGDVRVVGGRDKARNGTWMGATARGFFVGVTNQRTGDRADGALRSRGEVVLEALRLGALDEVTRYLAALDGAAYNPCNLLFGDASGVRVAYVRPEAPYVTIGALDRGVHVLANDRLGSPTFPKAARAAATIRALDELARGDDDALGDALQRVMASHEVPPDAELPRERSGTLASLLPSGATRPLHALCVHTAVYGTVSATQMLLGDARVERYRFAEGPPCEAAFRDVTALFASPLKARP